MSVEGWDHLVKRGWTVTPLGCWEYDGYRNSKNGYGRVSTSEGRTGAHRVSYKQHHGDIPEGHYVRHKCDNPPCINPEHLESGTPKQNMEDRDARGRGPKGERNGFSKLTNGEVSEIRQALDKGESPLRIAPKYGVHFTTIYRIRTNTYWRADS